MPVSKPPRRRWRAGSIFGAGPRRALSQDDRRIWRARIELHRRAGRLTLGACRVAEALLRRLAVDGRCDPSHATLADDAGLSERTVRRALAALAEVKMVTWAKRIVRVGSWGCAQTSNGYALALGAAPAPTETRQSTGKSSDGQFGRGTLKNIFSKVAQTILPLPSAAEQAAARKALEVITAKRGAALRLI